MKRSTLLPAALVILSSLLPAGRLAAQAAPAPVLPAGGPPGAARPAETAAPAVSGGPKEAAGGAAQLQKAAPAVKHPETYLEFAIAGGPVMILLGLASIFLLAYLAERLIVTRKSRVLPRPLVQAFRAGGRAKPPAPGEVDALCAAHPSAAAVVLKTAVGHLGDPRPELEQAVNSVAQREVRSLRKNLRVFAVLATVTPLLGLLGTVTGLIGAFRQVAIQGLGQGQAYAAGIYEALANTVAGLLVAIPALLVYYWLTARVDHYVHEIDDLVIDLVEANRRPALP